MKSIGRRSRSRSSSSRADILKNKLSEPTPQINISLRQAPNKIENEISQTRREIPILNNNVKPIQRAQEYSREIIRQSNLNQSLNLEREYSNRDRGLDESRATREMSKTRRERPEIDKTAKHIQRAQEYSREIMKHNNLNRSFNSERKYPMRDSIVPDKQFIVHDRRGSSESQNTLSFPGRVLTEMNNASTPKRGHSFPNASPQLSNPRHRVTSPGGSSGTFQVGGVASSSAPALGSLLSLSLSMLLSYISLLLSSVHRFLLNSSSAIERHNKLSSLTNSGVLDPEEELVLKRELEFRDRQNVAVFAVLLALGVVLLFK